MIKKAFLFLVILFPMSVVSGAFIFDETLNFILFVCIDIVAFVVLSEITFRSAYYLTYKTPYKNIESVSAKYNYIEPHPNLPFVYKRNAISPEGRAANYPLHPKRYSFVSLKTNNLRTNNGVSGDREIEMPKPQGKKRIVCLGESTTGNYIREGDRIHSYPLELEKILQEKGEGSVEVLNFGQGGYTSADLMVRFNLQILDCEPDVIVIYHAFNDVRSCLTPGFASDFSHSRQNLGNTYWQYALAEYLPNIPLKFYNFIVNSFISTNFRTALLNQINLGQEDLKQDVTEGLNTYRRNIQTIIDVCKARAIDVILSTHCFYLYDEIQNNESQKVYFSVVDKMNSVMVELSKENNVELVDNAQLVSQNSINFVDNIHFTPEGMRAIAGNIADTILQKK